MDYAEKYAKNICDILNTHINEPVEDEETSAIFIPTSSEEDYEYSVSCSCSEEPSESSSPSPSPSGFDDIDEDEIIL